MKQITLSKPGLIIGIVILLAIAAFIIFKKIVNSQPNFINNCSEAKARHLTNIPKGSVYYRESLDRDRDGVACES